MLRNGEIFPRMDTYYVNLINTTNKELQFSIVDYHQTVHAKCKHTGESIRPLRYILD